MHWRKSSRSASGTQCVEIGCAQGIIFARDSKNPVGPTLSCNHTEWSAFLSAVKNRELVLC